MFESEFWHPAVTADVACIDFNKDAEGIPHPYILLIKRKNDPFKGYFTLPGGFLGEEDEYLDDCVARKLYEETRINLSTNFYTDFHLVDVFSRKDRDPRERVISVLYYTLVDRNKCIPTAKDDAIEAKWVEIDDIIIDDLAFDYRHLIGRVMRRIVNCTAEEMNSYIATKTVFGDSIDNNVVEEYKNVIRRFNDLDIKFAFYENDKQFIYKHLRDTGDQEANEIRNEKLKELSKKLNGILGSSTKKVIFNNPINFFSYPKDEKYAIYGIKPCPPKGMKYQPISDYKCDSLKEMTLELIIRINNMLDCQSNYNLVEE